MDLTHLLPGMTAMLYGLMIHESGHVMIYTCFALPFYFFIKNKRTFLKYYMIGLFVTMLMDLDHFFDYFLVYGVDFSLSAFLRGNYFAQSGKVIVLLHAWEYVGILLLAVVLTKKSAIKWLLCFIALGLFAHLLYDTLYYGFSWDFYLLSKRMLMGFRVI